MQTDKPHLIDALENLAGKPAVPLSDHEALELQELGEEGRAKRLEANADEIKLRTDHEKAKKSERMARWFDYLHLPPDLAQVSREFCRLAVWIDGHLAQSPERTVALRKLLESKDAAVRAKLEAKADGA